MLHRNGQVPAALFLALCPALLLGQAARPQYYVVCTSQANQPTVYFSGVLQGPVTALQPFRTAFVQFLLQNYSYKGAVVCSPTNTAANAQIILNRQATSYRALKKNVVETGWTESAPAANTQTLTALAPAVNGSASQSAAGGASGATASQAKPAAATTSTGSTGASSEVASVLGGIFGTNTGSNGASGGSGAQSPGGTPGATGGRAQSGTAGSTTGGAGGTTATPAAEISSTLSHLFGKKSTSNPSAGGNSSRSAQPSAGSPAAPVAAASPKNAQSNLPAGALGMAQSGTTQLVVLGCGRQDLKVACVTQLTNQNAKDTLVQSADVWKDAFIVDDRGDRHPRTSGVFLNIDGDQRDQIDVSYGKSVQFVLMFDNVQTKVQKVALRSETDGLDVEGIALVSPNAVVSASANATPGSGAPAGK